MSTSTAPEGAEVYDLADARKRRAARRVNPPPSAPWLLGQPAVRGDDEDLEDAYTRLLARQVGEHPLPYELAVRAKQLARQLAATQRLDS